VWCGGGPSAFELAENIEGVDILSHYMGIGPSIRATYGFGVVRLELGAVFGITKPQDAEDLVMWIGGRAGMREF
jgi:hypothetical protein